MNYTCDEQQKNPNFLLPQRVRRITKTHKSSDAQSGKTIISSPKSTHNHVLSIVTQTYSVQHVAWRESLSHVHVYSHESCDSPCNSVSPRDG